MFINLTSVMKSALQKELVTNRRSRARLACHEARKVLEILFERFDIGHSLAL